MGSVLAASSPNPPPAAGGGAQGGTGLVNVPPGFTMPPVSSVPPGPGTATQEGDTESPPPNPGTFEECHRKCKGKAGVSCMSLKLNSCVVVGSPYDLKECSLSCDVVHVAVWFWNESCYRGLPPSDGRRATGGKQRPEQPLPGHSKAHTFCFVLHLGCCHF